MVWVHQAAGSSPATRTNMGVNCNGACGSPKPCGWGSIPYTLAKYARVVQGLEYCADNAGVDGSNPSTSTNKIFKDTETAKLFIDTV